MPFHPSRTMPLFCTRSMPDRKYSTSILAPMSVLKPRATPEIIPVELPKLLIQVDAADEHSFPTFREAAEETIRLTRRIVESRLAAPLWLVVTQTREIDPVLLLPAAAVELNCVVPEDAAPQDLIAALEGLFVTGLGNLRCSVFGHGYWPTGSSTHCCET